MMNSWCYNGEAFIDTPEEYIGFVYEITELDTSKKYIGKKRFWAPKVLPVTKKRKRRVRTRVESDWRKYYGSSKEVQLLVEKRGFDNYKREILKLCVGKGEMSYWEVWHQITNHALLKPDEYYNAFIGCKIHRNHILKK